MTTSPFTVDVTPDRQGLIDCIKRKKTPQRVHFIELFLDDEVEAAVATTFGLADQLDPNDKFFAQKRHLAVQRFLGYDYVHCSVTDFEFPLKYLAAEDTADLRRRGGRQFIEEHDGPITNWQEFEAYPWPNPNAACLDAMRWYQENLPDDMCIIAWPCFGHLAELLSWLMGYETLCYALYDQRDLVRAISDRVIEISQVTLRQLLAFDRVELVWASDDMGFRSGTLISPADLREFVLPGHKLLAQMAHETHRPYLLHACGKLDDIMEDLIDDVGIDGKHSFEDTIEDVCDVKQSYGDRIALLGGIDVDFLCRADQQQIRTRVRDTLQKCMPGGGFCLGTGNTVANYIPLDNYLVMLDEGRRFDPS